MSNVKSAGSRKQTIAVMVAVGVGTFMSALDSSVVNVTIPMIQKDFSVSLSMVEWIITSYLLVVSSLLLTYGRLSDLYGHKKMYSIGMVIFIVGSLACGMSHNIWLLIGSRVLQALGAGMIFSTGPAIITNSVAPENRGKALSVTAIAVALGLCTGPVIGGALSVMFGWESIFFINLPIGLVALILVSKNIPKDSVKSFVPFDYIGSSLIFVALFLILLPLNISGNDSIPRFVIVGLVVLGITVLGLFIRYESKCKHPMLQLSLFNNRAFSASNLAAMFVFMAQFIMVFLIPLYLQNLRHFSPLICGLLYLPMPIATMLVAPFSGIFSDRFDSRILSAAGNLVMGIGLLTLSFLDLNTSSIFIVIAMFITGIGVGMFQTPNNSTIMGSVPIVNRGTASGTLATMRNIGMALGVALSGALFAMFYSKGEVVLAKEGIAGTLLQENSFVYALHFTFFIAASISIVAMVASLAKGNTQMEAD